MCVCVCVCVYTHTYIYTYIYIHIYIICNKDFYKKKNFLIKTQLKNNHNQKCLLGSWSQENIRICLNNQAEVPSLGSTKETIMGTCPQISNTPENRPHKHTVWWLQCQSCVWCEPSGERGSRLLWAWTLMGMGAKHLRLTDLYENIMELWYHMPEQCTFVSMHVHTHILSW